MKLSRNIAFLLLLITSIIWGVAFVFQTTGGAVVGAFSFCFARTVVGGLALIPAVVIFDKKGMTSGKAATRRERVRLAGYSCLCGFFLAMTLLFQQQALNMGTPAGKAGFITACYIIIIPIIGLFLKKRVAGNVWLAVVIALAGLYMLCMSGDFSFQLSDILVVICAFMIAFHLVLVDICKDKVDIVRLSCYRCFFAALFCFIPAFITEMGGSIGGLISWSRCLLIPQAWIAVLYAGILSTGVAYMLSTIGQKMINPTVASLVLSLESVFSAIGGWILLGQVMSLREIIGCIIIFAAIVLAQLRLKPIKISDK